jgi:hypothetical protein
MKTLVQILSSRKATTERISRWSTDEFVATAADAKKYDNLTAGVTYILWVAQSNFETKSGSTVTKGEFFFMEKPIK